MLWDVLEDAYARLGFDGVGNDTFKKLVLARVVEPTSKADTLRVWDELGVPGAPSLSAVWRTLARSVEQDWRSKVGGVSRLLCKRLGVGLITGGVRCGRGRRGRAVRGPSSSSWSRLPR